jgi:PII-like signaling protein
MGGFDMKGTLLRLYVHENRRHDHVLLYEWLLAEARKLGIQGGSAFRAIAGFGRHGVLHEERFFELAGDLTVAIDFAVEADDAQRLLDRIRTERIGIFYVRLPIEFDVVDGDD